MKIIGLTGGTGSGKSTVAGFLAELGAAVIDVDKVGHETLKIDEVKGLLVKEFGEEILIAGEIDRSRLGGLVFNDDAALKRLNRLLHPVIFRMVSERLEDFRRRGVAVAVLDVPLMLETGRDSEADEVWVTTAPESTVLKRLRERSGLSEAEARARIKTQLPGEYKKKLADVVIDTDCSLEELKKRVQALWRERRLTRS